MDFGDERFAEYVKADFSDSVKIIGEFNLNEEGNLEITDSELQALELSSISSYIDNPYAMEILKAILPDETK